MRELHPRSTLLNPNPNFQVAALYLFPPFQGLILYIVQTRLKRVVLYRVPMSSECKGVTVENQKTQLSVGIYVMITRRLR